MPKFTLVHAIRRSNGASPQAPSSERKEADPKTDARQSDLRSRAQGRASTGAPGRASENRYGVDLHLDEEALNENAETVRHAEQAETAIEEPTRWPTRWLERISRSLGHQHLIKLVTRRGHVAKSLDDVPKRMHRVANQTRLVLELIDDFVEGRYRQIPWRSMAVLAGAVLYTVSPGDVVPDFLPFLGALDDLAILAVATRFLRKDLERYCRFKHYSVQAYFG
jgi:uncharacterized membrane protein YkvA (DUF1232 family)